MSTEWGLLKTGSVHSLGFSGKLGLSTVWGFGITAIWNPNVHNLGFRRNPTVQCLGTLPFEGCLQNGDVGAALPKPVSILRGIVYLEPMVLLGGCQDFCTFRFVRWFVLLDLI